MDAASGLGFMGDVDLDRDASTVTVEMDASDVTVGFTALTVMLATSEVADGANEVLLKLHVDITPFISV